MKPIFRSAMFGFHKEDVANFIAKQNLQFETRIAELQEKLETETRNFQKREQELIFEQEELANLRSEKNARNEAIGDLRQHIDRLAQQKDLLLSASAESEAAVLKLGENLDAMRLQLEKSGAYREKAKRFDRLAAVLGEIVSGKASEAEKEPEVEDFVVVQETCVPTEAFKKEREILSQLQNTCEELIECLNQLGEKA